MNSKDISNAIKARLLTVAGAPSIAWPNVEFNSSVVPRWEATLVRQRTDPSLKGGGAIEREEGSLQVVLCVEHGLGEDAVLDYLDAVRTTFPKGQTFAVAGGTITVLTEPAETAQGFPDTKTYRSPIALQYVANAT